MRGWVYIITNPAMPGLVKIGFSMKDPELRALELNHTGSPHPYIVDYDVLVEEPRDIEQKLHSELDDLREGKEWFRCTVEQAVAAVESHVSNKAILINYRKTRQQADELAEQQKRFFDESKKIREADYIKKRDKIAADFETRLNELTSQGQSYSSGAYQKLLRMRDEELAQLAEIYRKVEELLR